MECSEDFRASNFGLSEITYQNGNIKKQLPMYYITRDGFMFLVMGFTGKTAAKWKEAYIKAFNDMEAKIRAEQMEKQVEKAIEERDQKEYEEYLEQVRREDEYEYQHDKEVDEWHENRRKEEARKKAEEAKQQQAQAQTTAEPSEQPQPTTTEQQPIVEIMDGKRVISSRTLATLTGRRHGDVMDSVQRMFKYSNRPSRMFIKSDDWAKKTNCLKAKRCYYITVGGFAMLCKHTWSISSEVHRLVLAAFGNNTGLSREQLALSFKADKPKAAEAKRKPAPTTPPAPTPQPTAKTATEQPQQPTTQPQAPTVATMPQTPADLMQRFVKAMGVMMGVDTKEMFNLMDKGE